MSENPDSGIAEDEEMTSHLLGLLYPDEVDNDLGGEDDYSDQEELSEFRGLLGHFRDMPEEEPSAAVSNKLLALAAKHAPAKRKGFFAWLSDVLLPTAYHPGLASAASLVLIAGLAGTLYVNGKSQVAEPMVATEAVAPQSESALGTARLADPSEVPAAAVEEATEGLAKTVAEDPAPIADTALADDRGFDKAPAREAADDSMAFKAEAERDTSLDGKVVGGILGEGKGGGGDAIATGKQTGANTQGASTSEPATQKRPIGDAEVKRARKSKVAPPPPPKQSKPKAPAAKPAPVTTPTSEMKPEPAPEEAAPTPAPADRPANESKEKAGDSVAGAAGDDDDDDDESGGEAVQSEPEASKVNPEVEAAAIHKKAIAAAKKNQCSTVKSLGQAIRKLSSSYYDRTFLSDKRLTACLAPEVKK